MKKRVCAITGTRAEYGLLSWTLKALRGDPDFTLLLVATGAHLSHKFGHTLDEIKKDGFTVDQALDLNLGAGTPESIARSTGLAVAGLAEALVALQPDLVLVVGDRYEIAAAAIASTICGVPIAHCHGGETTAGAMDDAFRHAVTKMSHLHFVATDSYRHRVIQMGEEPSQVFVVGALGVESIHKGNWLSKEDLRRGGMRLGEVTMLVTYHPETIDGRPGHDIKELTDALREVYGNIIITGPNADVESEVIVEHLRDFTEANSNRVQFYTSLGQQRYLALMKHCNVVVGNSSSGIIEAPSLGIPTVNIGKRQQGRVRAESVIDCEPAVEAIRKAIDKALSPAFRTLASRCQNPYDRGDASEKIVDVLRQTDLSKLHNKHFHEIG